MAGRFPPTAEQSAIVAAATARGNVAVRAGAGTGKTSTMELVAEELRHGGQVVVIVYNADAARDAKARFPAGVRCTTAHGLAYRDMVLRTPHEEAWRRRLGFIKDEGYSRRQSATQTARLLGLSGPLTLAPGAVPLSPQQVARVVMGTVRKFCYSAQPRIDGRHVRVPDAVEDPAAVAALRKVIPPLAQAAWDGDLADPNGTLPFDPDFYLKRWQLTDPTINASVIVLDEAQDANPVMAHVVWRQGMRDKGGKQLVIVGDENQAINGWRGCVDAISKFAAHPSFTTLDLTQTFRYGPAIAAQANRWLNLLGTDLRIRGYAPAASTVGEVAAPDAILCRSNGGAVEAAIAELKAGRKVAMGKLAAEILSLAQAAQDLQAGRGTAHPDLCGFHTWGQVQDFVAEEKDAARDLAVLVKVIDETGVDVVIAMVRQAVSESEALAAGGVVVCTAHRSKGREWDTVRIWNDFYEPRKDKKTGEYVLDRAELMLAYVAVTRAKRRLDVGGLAWLDEIEGELLAQMAA